VWVREFHGFLKMKMLCALVYLLISGSIAIAHSQVVLPVPSPGPVLGQPIDAILHFPGGEGLEAFPGVIFSGDRGCSPSALLSYLTIQKQVVPQEEQLHYSVRLLQTPSNFPNADPDNVVWLDLETGVIVKGLPQLNWTQQTTVFNYSLLTPGLADIKAYRVALNSLAQLVMGLAIGSQSSNPRYKCASSNAALEPLAEYLADMQADVANSSQIDGGLKKGIEYRVPGGCIVELDALYAGEAIGPPVVLGPGINLAGGQPTEDDCCRACRRQTSCSVFNFCPSFEGCKSPDGATFPAFGCQLRQANLSSDPADFPPALARGPPVAFKSGRLA